MIESNKNKKNNCGERKNSVVMVEYFFVEVCVCMCEMTSYVIPTSHPWMFDGHQTKKASGIEHEGQEQRGSDTCDDKVSPWRWLGPRCRSRR